VKISEEIQSLKPYSTGKPIAETKREFGLDRVYKLASNENPLGPSPKVIEAIAAELENLHRYPDASFYELKEAFSEAYGFPQNWFTFGNGSNELIDLLIRVFCPPGHSVLTSENAFVAYGICTKAARVQFLTAPMSEDAMRFDLDEIYRVFSEQNASKNIRLIFIANPNNPTGGYVNKAELENFLEKMKDEKETLIILDEAYLEFVTASDFPKSLDLVKAYENVLLTRTMSKVHGLAGLRVGSLLGRPEYIELIDRVRNPFNVNSLAQTAAIVALNDHEYLQRVQKTNTEGLEYFYVELAKLEIRFWKSQANFLLFESPIDGQKLYNELLQRGVIVRPMPLKEDKTFIRMSVGTAEENQAAVKALQQILS